LVKLTLSFLVIFIISLTQAETLYRDGKIEAVLQVWLEAYKEMPNNVQVKEMLMSTYYLWIR